jgi:hypothetical protein
MTEDQMIEDQDIELHDDDNEVVEEAMAHDPKNAEAQSVASVDKAGDATGTAKKRKGDNTKQDPMQKAPSTKAGMINAAYMKMSKMKKEDLASMYGKIMAESVEDEEGEVIETTAEINYEADFSEDLNAIMANEATLSEEFKEKTAIIFEAAIKSKLAEEIDRLEEKYNEELGAEIESTKSDLVEKVDSYLNYVVENWMEENKVAIQTGLRTEIAEDFMNNLKNLFTESYIEVPEGKVDLVDELAETVEELEEKLNAQTGQAIAMAEELETYKRDAIIREAARDLADTQVEKLKSLVDDIDFDDEETFASKVATVKESYFTKKTSVSESADFESDDDDGETVEVSGSMAQYLNALNRTSKK